MNAEMEPHGSGTENGTSDIAPPLGFAAGLRDGVSIFIGYLPIAIAFGLLAKATGVPLEHSVGMSVLVFAGASQFMALELIALGTGAFELIISTFIVNIRHLLMSMSINERAVSEGRGKKGLYAFFITDEVFALASTREGRVGSKYLYGIGLMAYLSWTANSALGYAVGSFLPKTLQEAMGVALYAMFIGLLVPTAKKETKVVLLAASAALLNSIFSLFLPTGWAIISAAALSVLLFEALQSGREAMQEYKS